MSFPSFYALSSAWLFFLVGPLVLFYFLKLKRPRLDIPSLFLWRQVINDSRVNTPFQRFKRNLLLLLQLLALVLLILAAMQPYWRGEAAQRQRLPILIDCSASMGALDEPGGATRLAAAKERITQLIEGLLGDRQLCLISFGRRARKRTGFTNNKRILREALEQMAVEDVPSDIEDALRMTQALARSVSLDEVLLYSDGNFPARADFELPFELNYQQLPAPGQNIGVTSLNARRSGKGAWNLFVRVEGTSETETGATVELQMEGEVFATEHVSIGKGKSARCVFRVAGDKPTSLSVRLVPDGFDSLPSDNTAFIDLPAVRDLRVFVPSSMKSFRLALEALKGISLCAENDLGGTDDTFDLVVTDRRQDLPVEGGTCLYVGLVPEKLKQLVSIVREGQEGSEVVDWRRSSGLLQHVELTDLVVLDQPRSKDGAVEGDFENLGYEVLAHGQAGPLLLQKHEGERLLFYMLFHSDRSTLPYRVGFPVFVANLVEVALHQAGLSEARAGRTGVLAPLPLPADRLYRIESPDGSTRQERSSAEGILAGVPAPVAGRYRVLENGTLRAQPGVSLLSSSETSLAAIDKIHFNELSVSAAGAPLKTEKSLWSALTLLAFCALLSEWWYFHRRR